MQGALTNLKQNWDMALTAKAAKKRIVGMGQLSLVEHALCPLDSRVSLVENLVYSAKYSYSGKNGQRPEAQARVFSPLGLSASDELYLWGMLALSLLPQEPTAELVATPHWILRQLGIINQGSKRGGRQYKQFSDALRRLSVVNYLNDGFYDPVRGEHRRVSFRFFSYSLPTDLQSSRAWRIAWDPIFFDMVKDTAGQFRFDLAVYRELDAASRRLFLFASKVPLSSKATESHTARKPSRRFAWVQQLPAPTEKERRMFYGASSDYKNCKFCLRLLCSKPLRGSCSSE